MVREKKEKSGFVNYRTAGVDYEILDAFKRFCQQEGSGSADFLKTQGWLELAGTRGESCYVIEAEDAYYAHVEEGLGTKILVADTVYRLTGRSYYRQIAIDNVAAIVNDLVVCGAQPVSLAMYVAVGENAYLADELRARDLAEGFAEGCRMAGAAWGGGETQTLKGMVSPGTAILGGSAWGRIAPKTARIKGEIRDGDAIVFLSSSGVHANGLTLCRSLAERLPQGYSTRIPDAPTFGEALLAPSVIYAAFVGACQEAGVDLHYAVHLTGHGWRKLMRPAEPFVYYVEQVPPPMPVFDFIARKARLDPHEMYGIFNMGAGFAVYVGPEDGARCVELSAKQGYTAWVGGAVRKEGTRKAVVLKPLGLIYEAATLNIR